MAPCPKTSGNVSNTFPDIELNSSENLMSDVYSDDYSIPHLTTDIDFYLPSPPSDFQNLSMYLSTDVQFNGNENANVHTDLSVSKSNNDFYQEVPSETNEDKPSHLLDHSYSLYSPPNLEEDDDPDYNAVTYVSSESISTSTVYETSSTGSPVTDEEIDVGNEEEITVLPVNIEIQNCRRRGQQRAKNNIRQIIEKEQNETHSRRKRKKNKGKVEKDEETRSRHNRMERERRLEIRLAFKNLASTMNVPSKHSNVNLLNKAVTVITDLEEKERKSSLMSKELKEQNEILKRKLSKLQKHFK